MDALSLLREDHRRVEKLFTQFEDTTARAHKTRNDLVGKMIRELSQHAAIEEQFFYPLIRRAVSDLDDMVLEALEEHHVVKWTLSELDGMDASDERFGAKVLYHDNLAIPILKATLFDNLDAPNVLLLYFSKQDLCHDLDIAGRSGNGWLVHL